MIEPLICGVDDLDGVLGKHSPDLIVSISDPGDTAVVPPSRATILQLSFHDINKIRPGMTAPARQHLSTGFDFLQAHWRGEDMRLLVHCQAGVSRSPAFAAALMAYAHSKILQLPVDAGHAQGIARVVSMSAPAMLPNQRILSAAEKILPEWRGLLGSAMRDMSATLLVARQNCIEW